METDGQPGMWRFNWGTHILYDCSSQYKTNNVHTPRKKAYYWLQGQFVCRRSIRYYKTCNEYNASSIVSANRLISSPVVIQQMLRRVQYTRNALLALWLSGYSRSDHGHSVLWIDVPLCAPRRTPLAWKIDPAWPVFPLSINTPSYKRCCPVNEHYRLGRNDCKTVARWSQIYYSWACSPISAV